MSDPAQFQEWSKLAYRALDDCYRVLSTIEPADTDEQDRMDELTERVRDLVYQALSLNGLSSFNYHALKALQPNNTGVECDCSAKDMPFGKCCKVTP